jgi:hypothetical protein
VLAFSDIIDFLLRILDDDEARAEFEQDPQGTLERAGLEGVSAQDIRDARLQLADSGAVHATDDGSGSSYPDGDDPVREIGYTTQHYVADENVDHDAAGNADLSLVDRGSTVVTIDDRDTLFFQSISDDDVTVTDNSVTITDSFNQDNSDDDLVAIQDNDTTVSDDDVIIDADNSFNEDNDLTAIQDNDVNGGDEVIVVNPDGAAAPPADPEPVDGPALPVDLDEPVEPEPAVDLEEPVEPEPAPVEDVEDETPVDDGGAGDLATDDSDALAV